MQRTAIVASAALIVLAFAAATRVADTREGLIAEVITLLAGAAGLTLGTYAYAARKRPAPPEHRDANRPIRTGPNSPPRDLALGAVGIGLSIVLLAGLGISGGFLWAGLGFLLLLPMLSGSVYLCWRALKPNS